MCDAHPQAVKRGYSWGGAPPRRRERFRADRNASGVSRRDDSTSSYRNARSPNVRIGRTRSKRSNKYSSSSGSCTVGSLSPAASYLPRPLRLMSPSRTSRVSAKVIEERLDSGIAVTISRAETGLRAAVTYSYTRWMIAFVSRIRSKELSSGKNIILSTDNSLSSGGGRR